MNRYVVAIKTDKNIRDKDIEEVIKDCLESCGIKSAVKVVQKV